MKSTETLRQTFYLFQIFLGLTGVGIAWLVFRSAQPKTGFKVREADRPDRGKPTNGKATSENKHTRESKPLLLTGLRIDGSPHEILGISVHSTADEIQAAYLELIKRFHPDKIGPAGSREWKDAQAIAAAINLARNQMLEKLSKK